MKRNSVFAAVCGAAAAHRLLSVGTLLCAAASVLASLLPPLLLARVIDGLTGGIPLTFAAALLYFGSLALEGVLASAQETLLEILGQKMTHALRAEMSRKLTRLPAATLSAQNPGELAARFSGDVDTVEALFTSGVISMAADACRILSILAVIAVKNAGLALILGIDRFMSEARALTNLVGNGVATVVVAKWCKQLDNDQLQAALSNKTVPDAEIKPGVSS